MDLLHFLLNPEHYPEKPSSTTHIETHISHVFLCDDFVYKVKKPVNLGFVDFSTLRKRHFYCRKEVILNSRLAGDTYIGVISLYKHGDTFSFQKVKGSYIAEYAVKMKKIPEELILYNLIGRGKPLYGELEQVGKALASFHNGAPIYRGNRYGGLETVLSTTGENFTQIKPFCGITVDERFYHELIDYTGTFIKENKDMFSGRRKSGHIREGHGDLHSQHVCLARPPIIFDCIEFNEKFRIIDVLEDIAFLFMDLEYRGRFDLSARFFKAYSTYQRDDFNEELLRFYKLYRAVVRGKVDGFLAHDSKDEHVRRKGLKMAKDYFKLAEHYLHDYKNTFNPVVIMGLSGSGKSTIAKDFSKDWVILRSDEIRKTLSGIKKEVHEYGEYGTGIYSSDMSGKIYALLLEETIKHVQESKRVVVDATFLQSAQRMGFYLACMKKGLNPFFIHCFAREDVLRERIKKRMEEGSDISDAHLGILSRQIEDHEEPAELPYFRVLRLNTEEGLHDIVNSLKEFL